MIQSSPPFTSLGQQNHPAWGLGLPVKGFQVELCGYNLAGPTAQADMRATALGLIEKERPWPQLAIRPGMFGEGSSQVVGLLPYLVA